VLRAVLILFFVATLIDMGLALLQRQSIMAPTLTYWDEAAMMLLVFLAVKLACPWAFSRPY